MRVPPRPLELEGSDASGQGPASEARLQVLPASPASSPLPPNTPILHSRLLDGEALGSHPGWPRAGSRVELIQLPCEMGEEFGAPALGFRPIFSCLITTVGAGPGGAAERGRLSGWDRLPRSRWPRAPQPPGGAAAHHHLVPDIQGSLPRASPGYSFCPRF